MNYFYEAIDSSGRTVLGKIDANTEGEAQRLLVQMGYRPQSLAVNPGAANATVGQTITAMGSLTGMPASTVAPANTMRPGVQTGMQTGVRNRSAGIIMAGNAAKVRTQPVNRTGAYPPQQALPGYISASPNASTLAGVSTRDLLLFFQQLASLVKSGMTIYSALDNLAARTKNKNLAQVGRQMAAAAHDGKPVSDVMLHYPRIFPEHIAGMVRAGELGGFLEIVLAEIAQNYEQNIALYRGSWLPKMMAMQGYWMVALALPLFQSILHLGENGDFDFATNMRLYLLREMVILPIFGVVYLGIRWGARYVQLPHLRRFRDTWSLRLPAFGDLQRQVALCAFVRMLRKLYHAGVAPIHAWEAAMNTADNTVIRERLAASYGLMQQGRSFSDAFAATGLFADNVEQLVVTGQMSGEVVESLDQAADIYMERVEEAHRKSRFMILRMGILAMILLGGFAMIWMFRSYDPVGFVDNMFKHDLE